MDREAAFAAAAAVISRLPRNGSVTDFWETPRLSSSADRTAWTAATDALERIGQAVDPEIAMYFQRWASDAAVGAGDLARGYQIAPPLSAGARQSTQADDRLSLKLALALPVEARDMTSLFGPKVTAFGRRNIDAIELHLQVQLDFLAINSEPVSVESWTLDAHRHPAGYSLFTGHPSYLTTTPPVGWHFSLSPTAEAMCVSMIREAENTWREESDLPRVGEGWLAETALYYSVRGALPHLAVRPHYRPEWLGRQHLDIALPEIRVAIEFQGAQHDQPVAFFGGAEGFAKTVERDQRKLSKCRRHGWRLIYVRDGYLLVDVLAKILA